jgi:PhnB protein
MTRASDRTEILNLIERAHRAHHDKDTSAIIAPYTQDARIFDLAPPLAQTGVDPRQLQAWLDTWEGPVDRESRDVDLSIDGDLAFAHGFFQLSALSKSSGHAVFWFRATLCLRRIAGSWRIVHEHTSVPFYMDGSFRAATDLQP